jgi:hypothetical protein
VRRFAGIDVGAEAHMVAVVDDSGAVLRKSTAFGETRPVIADFGNCWENLGMCWSRWRRPECTGEIYSPSW